MPFRVHVVHESDARLWQRLDWLYAQGERLHNVLETVLTNQAILNTKLETIMATLDDVLADVTAESAGIDSLGVLITQLKEQVAGATSGTLPPDVQAKVDAIFTQAEANKAKIMAAINAQPGSTPPTVAAPLRTDPAPGNTIPATNLDPAGPSAGASSGT